MVNAVLIKATSTAAGGAALTALPVADFIQALGCALVVIGTMIGTRHHAFESVHTQLDQIRAHAKRNSNLNREQAEVIRKMRKSVEDTGPQTLPPPPLRRIS